MFHLLFSLRPAFLLPLLFALSSRRLVPLQWHHPFTDAFTTKDRTVMRLLYEARIQRFKQALTWSCCWSTSASAFFSQCECCYQFNLPVPESCGIRPYFLTHVPYKCLFSLWACRHFHYTPWLNRRLASSGPAHSSPAARSISISCGAKSTVSTSDPTSVSSQHWQFIPFLKDYRIMQSSSIGGNKKMY